MAPRKKPMLLALGKSRTLGGSARPWRVRLYAPAPGGAKYQVMFRAPGGDGEPRKRVLRRANSEVEARKIFNQAEAALDTEQALPAGADLRASRTIRMLGEEFVHDSVARRHRRHRFRRSRRCRRIAGTVDLLLLAFTSLDVTTR